MDKEKVRTLFMELLEAYKESETMVIDERGTGAEYDALDAEIEEWKKEFLEALGVN